jgi:ABC-2 type transport system ATP-binding protein
MLDRRMPLAISCRALVKRYGDKTAVDGIDLEVEPGQCLGLLGPNGAGKTTTVEMLEGLSTPDSGNIELFGLRWGQGRDHELRQRLGVQLQDTTLADKLEVEEVLYLFRSFCERGRRISDVLDWVGLEQERHVRYHTLSGGQKQRVAIACALVGDPELLFLDEPTTGLDPRARKSLWQVVERFRHAGGTVLITTHYMEEAAALCDRIAIMDHGRLIAEGTPAELVDGLGQVQFVEFESAEAVDLARLEALTGVLSVTRKERKIHLRAGRDLEALSAILDELRRQSVTPIGLSTHQATLDDVFLQLTGRGLQSGEADGGVDKS